MTSTAVPISPSNKYILQQTNPYRRHQLDHRNARLHPNQRIITSHYRTTYPRQPGSNAACKLVLSKPYFIEKILINFTSSSKTDIQVLDNCDGVNRAFRRTVSTSAALQIARFRGPPLSSSRGEKGPQVLNPAYFSQTSDPIIGIPGQLLAFTFGGANMDLIVGEGILVNTEREGEFWCRRCGSWGMKLGLWRLLRACGGRILGLDERLYCMMDEGMFGTRQSE